MVDKYISGDTSHLVVPGGKTSSVSRKVMMSVCRHLYESESVSRSVVSDSSQGPHGLQPYQAPPSMGFSMQEYWSGGAITFSVSVSRNHLQVSFSRIPSKANVKKKYSFTK